MTSHRSHLIAYVLLAGLGMGCKEPAPSTTTASEGVKTTASTSTSASGSSAASAQASAVASNARAAMPHGGVVGMVAQAARRQPLTEEQKAKIDAAEKNLREEGAAPMAQFKALNDELIAGIRAGKIDDQKLAEKRAAVEKTMKSARDNQAESLNGIYAALTPEQRKAVVAELRVAIRGRAEPSPSAVGAASGAASALGSASVSRGEGSHGSHAGDGGVAPTDGGVPSRQMLARLTGNLDLDAAQQKKVEALFARHAADYAAATPLSQEATKKRLEATLDAFDQDAFDASKLEAFQTPAGDLRGPLSHGSAAATFLQELLPILTPEQREKLAVHLSPGPHFPMRPSGHGSGPGGPSPHHGPRHGVGDFH